MSDTKVNPEDLPFAKLREFLSRKSVLDEAHDIIYGDREKTYGSPAKNLQAIADYWINYLRSIDYPEKGLTAEDVCNMMILLKVARLGNTPGHRDSLVDICGYTALIERIRDAHKPEEAGFAPASEGA